MAKSHLKKTETLIISDIHLGTEVSRAKKVGELLKSYSFKKLILLGDIFENLDFEDLTTEHWNLISQLRKISQRSEVIWIEGNHDKGLSKIFSNLLGTPVFKTYSWKHHGKKCLAIHGHQFDRFLINNIVLSYLASWTYLFIQKIEFSDRRISRYIKKKSKGWLRLSKKVADSAIWYGRLRGADYVFCGHTHRAIKKSKKGVRYFNSGCWTDIPSTFITLDKGLIKIHKKY